MFILFKGLSSEPAENLVTALHWQFAQVVYFGRPDIIRQRKAMTRSFLKKYCGVSLVQFIELPENDLAQTISLLRGEILPLTEDGHKVFADLTGASGLLCAAFGAIEKEMLLPLHLYVIEKEECIPQNPGTAPALPQTVPAQTVPIELDRYIEMHSGVINYRMHKEIKGINSKETDEQINRLWDLFTRFEEGWPTISSLIQRTPVEDDLSARLEVSSLRSYLKKNPALTPEEYISFLTQAETFGLIRSLQVRKTAIRFVFRNRMVRSTLIDAGSILELHVYQKLRRTMPNSKVGVHLDWDGVIHTRAGEDVLNEIDVLSLSGLIPVFVSCKIGRANKNALYELSAVAGRFGGRYAKKVLVSAKEMTETDLNRAKEMGIEVVDKDRIPK